MGLEHVNVLQTYLANSSAPHQKLAERGLLSEASNQASGRSRMEV
jgi:hypothetical protein